MLNVDPHSDLKEEESARKDFSKVLLSLFGILIMVTSLFLVLDPNLRNRVRSLFRADARKVLTTVSGDLMGNGENLTVVKVKTKEGLLLEIYRYQEERGSSQLIERIELEDRRDGYFHYNGIATNLVLDDINNNKRLDLITSSFDEDFVAHLSIFEFDPLTGAFQPITQ